MSRQLKLTDELLAYLHMVSLREAEPLRQLREETARLPMAGMQISPDQGQFMALLVRLLGARRCLEIGTFTGYSALAVALALPPGGRIVCCDLSEEWTSIARKFWKLAGVAKKIDLRLAPVRTGWAASFPGVGNRDRPTQVSGISPLPARKVFV